MTKERIDFLISVRATFYKAGTIVSEYLEEELDLTSYGLFLDEVAEEYWSYPEDEGDSYAILKDFVGFRLTPIFTGNLTRPSIADWIFDCESLEEQMVGWEEELTKIAIEDKAGYEEADARLEVFELVKTHNESMPCDYVGFLVAARVLSEEVGAYDCRELETHIDIIGRIDECRMLEGQV